MALQIAFDIAWYIEKYEKDIGYESHFFGFASGFTFAGSLAFLYPTYIVSRRHGEVELIKTGFSLYIYSLFSMIAFGLIVGYLTYKYSLWSPEPFQKPFIHNGDADNTCCSKMWDAYEKLPDDVTWERLQDSSICNGYDYSFNLEAVLVTDDNFQKDVDDIDAVNQSLFHREENESASLWMHSYKIPIVQNLISFSSFAYGYAYRSMDSP